MWRVVGLSFALGVAGCSSDSETTQKPNDTADPCNKAALEAATAETRYYVAQNQPGADNDACDGLAPTDEGNGHCPWKDFTSPITLAALDQVKSVRLDVREGTYLVEGWEGIRVAGMGASEAERVILSAYPGESPILDIPRPDGVGCTDPTTAPSDPKCVREVVRASGAFVLIQGFTIRNGLAFHLEVTGAEDVAIRCNHFVETVAFPQRSDQMKLDAGSTRIEISHNEFEAFRSQAIDMAPGFDIHIEHNEFHHPLDDNSGIVGMKVGSSGVFIEDNDIHDLGSAFNNSQAFSLGGTGSITVDDGYTASDLHVTGNSVSNTHGILAQLIACKDCSVENNDLVNAGAGVFIRAQALGDPAQCTGGCQPSSNPHISGNRFRQMIGSGAAGTADSFVGAEAGEGQGIVAGANLYCAASVADAQFGWEGGLVDFDEWKTLSGSDADSVLVADTDPRCQGW